MFDTIGIPELVVIAGIALVILGPEKFPSQAKIFLRMMRDAKQHWEDAKRDITNELNPVKKELREFQKYKPEELLDKLTGEDQEANAESIGSSGEPDTSTATTTDGPGYAYQDSMEGVSSGANEAPVEFGSSFTAEPQGRSESTQWERTEPAETPSTTLTEEDEYRAAGAANDIRPKDGSD